MNASLLRTRSTPTTPVVTALDCFAVKSDERTMRELLDSDTSSSVSSCCSSGSKSPGSELRDDVSDTASVSTTRTFHYRSQSISGLQQQQQQSLQLHGRTHLRSVSYSSAMSFSSTMPSMERLSGESVGSKRPDGNSSDESDEEEEEFYSTVEYGSVRRGFQNVKRMASDPFAPIAADNAQLHISTNVPRIMVSQASAGMTQSEPTSPIVLRDRSHSISVLPAAHSPSGGSHGLSRLYKNNSALYRRNLHAHPLIRPSWSRPVPTVPEHKAEKKGLKAVFLTSPGKSKDTKDISKSLTSLKLK
ncbi:hypothetical protein MP638_003300 [Amoeboaphelidium occidentale]|nr:hypothetical protein MP638_003300 [Amoeboaphelidium occidentale]